MGITDIQNMLVGMCIFALVVVGCFMIIDNVQVNSPSAYRVDAQKLAVFKHNFNQTTQILAQKDSIQASIVDSNATGLFSQAYGVLGGLWLTGWNILKAIPSTFAGIYSIIGSASALFGIPVIMTNLIIAAIVIMVCFGILAAIFFRGGGV